MGGGLLGQTPSGAIQGTVSGEDGQAIAGALVAALRTIPALPPVSVRATSTTRGSFNLQNLPAGTYALCDQVPGGGFVDPCQCSRNQLTVDLAEGKVSTENTLRIKKGSILKV